MSRCISRSTCSPSRSSKPSGDFARKPETRLTGSSAFSTKPMTTFPGNWKSRKGTTNRMEARSFRPDRLTGWWIRPKHGSATRTRTQSTGRKTISMTSLHWGASQSESIAARKNGREGNTDDREDEHDGAEPDEDGEPSLGALEHHADQDVAWGGETF